MGHQTQVKECKKCKGITIVTYLGFGRKQITSTNCKCKKDEKTS